MKALILKDAFVLVKQLKLFLLLIIIFSCIPGFSASACALMYSAMLPMTAIAYDERCKWNETAAMMPYTSFQLVFSKYALGYIIEALALLLCLAAHAAASAAGFSAEADTPAALLTSALTAIVFTGINIPLIFRFGTEKTRYLIMLLAVLLILGFNTLSSLSVDIEALELSGSALAAAGTVFAVLFSALSVFISTCIYRKKNY